jgi:CYTH domain-containing protein
MAASGLEIERKFLVPRLPPDLDRRPVEQVQQGYLAIGDDGVEVRIRRRGERFLLTVKGAGDLARVEEEIEIGELRFRALWPLTAGRRIQKRRYRIEHTGAEVIELDVYEGPLSGLLTAEVEFESERAASAFEPPAWLGPEVTGDPRYKNRRLAIDGAPQ